jgi:hypothetical protein
MSESNHMLRKYTSIIHTDTTRYTKWIWRDSDCNSLPCEKSYIGDKPGTIPGTIPGPIPETTQKHDNVSVNQNQSSQSTRGVSIDRLQFAPNDNQSANNREDAYTKIAGREMLNQIGLNPYLTNSYVDALCTKRTS